MKTNTRADTDLIRPGLYHVVLEPADHDDIYAPSHGVTLQYKRSFGYFTLPGPSRDAVAFPVDVCPNGTALVEFPQAALERLHARLSTSHSQRLAKPYRPYRNRWERERAILWSKVAELRAKGEPYLHLFGAAKPTGETTHLVPPPRATFTPNDRSGRPETVSAEVCILSITRPAKV